MACVMTAAGAGALFYFSNLSSLLYSCNVSLGALAGILISPDLDLMETGNYSLVLLRKHSTWLANAYRWFWWPYAKLSHHRGISHWPVIGTLLRACYIFLWIIVIQIILIFFGVRYSLNYNLLAPELVGLMLADFTHIVLDVVI